MKLPSCLTYRATGRMVILTMEVGGFQSRKAGFHRKFFSSTFRFLPYKKEVNGVLECYFEELENIIQKIMPSRQAAIFKTAIDNNPKLERISVRMDKMAEDDLQEAVKNYVRCFNVGS